MAKRNSSGSSSGRRGSRTRTEGSSSSRGKSQPRSFKKSSSSSSSSGRSESSRDKRGPRKDSSGEGFPKKRYQRSDDSSERRGRSSGSGERRNSSGGERRNSSSGGQRRSSSGSSEKPWSSKREGGAGRKKSFDKDQSSTAGKRRPYSDSPRENKPREGSSVRDLRKSKDEERGFFKKSKARFSDNTSKVQPDLKPPVQTDKVRLNKYIANSGVCSRREADELISMGLISVNGKTVTELGYKVNPGDEVRYESKVLKAEKPVYILMNKPKGYLTTTDDPQERNTVMHIIGSAVKERIYPVGRLDRNTTGLLLLTNDGDLADKLMHPSHNIKKIYKVELDRPLTKADFLKVQEGVLLEEGRAMVDDVAIVSEDGKTVGVEIHIGWNRVVRRIFESLNYEVLKLDRSVYAGLDKKDLGRGQWRFLRKDEIVRLKHFKQE